MRRTRSQSNFLYRVHTCTYIYSPRIHVTCSYYNIGILRHGCPHQPRFLDSYSAHCRLGCVVDAGTSRLELLISKKSNKMCYIDSRDNTNLEFSSSPVFNRPILPLFLSFRPRMSHLDPSGINNASQQTLIEVLPSVFVIHLNRFLYDTALVEIGAYLVHSETSSFKSRLVLFLPWQPTLRIPDSLVGPDIMVHTTRQAEWPARYTLYGLLYQPQ